MRGPLATRWRVPIHLALAVVMALLTLEGCTSTERETPVERRSLTVGDHELSFVLPPELELIDLGGTVELRSKNAWPGDAAFERIVFQDLGPVKRDGTPLDSFAVIALGATGIDSLADLALERLGYDGRIEVERRHQVHVGDRRSVVLDTWYRSTHQRYRRLAIVPNGAALLAVEAQQGTWEIVGKHFEDVLTTVVFGSS